jgi:hypothetical protein
MMHSGHAVIFLSVFLVSILLMWWCGVGDSSGDDLT